MSVSACISTPIVPSTTIQSQPTNPLTDLFEISTKGGISCEARLLYVILTQMSWTKGYCWPSIQTQASYLGRSEDSICRYHRELVERGLLHIDRSGYKNFYYPRSVPGAGKHTRMGAPQDTRTDAALTLKEEFKNKTLHVPPLDQIERVPDPENDNVRNVIFSDHFQPQDCRPDPQPDPVPSVNTDLSVTTPTPQRASSPDTSEPETHKVFDTHLLSEILDLTGDTESRQCWISVIRQVPEDRIRYAMSCLTTAMNEGTVKRPGGYLLAVVMSNNPNLILRGRKYRSPQVSDCSEQYQPQTYDIPPQPETRRFHEPEPVEEIDTEALIKGWKLLYHPDKIQSVLFNIRQCLPGWDVTGTWKSLKQDREGQTEMKVLDEFLELAAFKVQFQSKSGTT